MLLRAERMRAAAALESGLRFFPAAFNIAVVPRAMPPTFYHERTVSVKKVATAGIKSLVVWHDQKKV